MSAANGKIIPRFLILIILSVLLIILDSFNFLSFPKKIITTATSPLEYGAYSTYQNLTSMFGFIAFWRSGYQEITYLKQRNLELLVDADLVRKLKEENATLASQFAISTSPAKNLLPARVLSSGKNLIIDKGYGDGVKTGQTVMLNNVLIGYIVKTDENLAKIVLPVDPAEKIAVQTSRNKTRGLIKGVFGSEMELSVVLTADKIDLEETVETFGDSRIESGLLVGKITKIIKADSALFQKAEVKPLLEYNKLNLVFVKIK